VYQNCNVFNDGAFAAVTAKEARPNMLIDLKHGEPIRFGAEGQHGVVLNPRGETEVVDVADVGEDRLLVHDEHRDDPSLAFALSRLADTPTVPTPVGVFRDVERPIYEGEVQRQLVGAQEQRGPGDLEALIGSGATWEVGG
jgi:2-oxoglutarate ferredoxin oxidoreductase subunit beta